MISSTEVTEVITGLHYFISSLSSFYQSPFSGYSQRKPTLAKLLEGYGVAHRLEEKVKTKSLEKQKPGQLWGSRKRELMNGLFETPS